MAALTTAGRKRQFLETLRPYARRFEQQTGIPAAWAMAMAANETGWDASNPVLFGIKGASPSGKSRVFKTTEDYGNGPVTVEARFAVYDDPGEGFDHLAQEMATARYRGAPRASAAAFARYLKDRGWATDPAYPGKITRLAGEIGAGGAGGGADPRSTVPLSLLLGMTDSGAGGRDIAEPTEKDDYRTQTLEAINAYIKTLEAERTSLMDEWQTLQQQLEAIPQAQRIYGVPPQLAAEQQRIRDALSQNATAMRSAQSTHAATSRVLANSLDDQLKLHELRIREGAETRAQANDRWDQALESAKLGVSSVLSGLGMIRQALPMAGDRKLATAIAQSVKNWNTLGGNVPTDWELPVYEFNPMKALGAYQPPAPDWQAAMTKAAVSRAREKAPLEGGPAAGMGNEPQAPVAAAPSLAPLEGDPAAGMRGLPMGARAPVAAAPDVGALPQWDPTSDWPIEAPLPYAPRGKSPALAPPVPSMPAGVPSMPAGGPTPGPSGPTLPPRQEGESKEEYLKRLREAQEKKRATFLRLDPADPRYQAIVAGDGGLDDLLALLGDYAPRGVGA